MPRGPTRTDIDTLEQRGSWLAPARKKEVQQEKERELALTIVRPPFKVTKPKITEMCRTEIPGYDPWRDAGDCRFDAVEAQRRVRFFWTHLSHIKGAKALQAFVLEPWQVAIIGNLFGWKRTDGTRRYREAYVTVGRKNGKTLMGAGMALCEMFMGSESGAEIYSCAAEREQAALAFDVAKYMVARSPGMDTRFTSFRRALEDPLNKVVYKPISAQAHSKHGYGPHFVLSDELHAQPNRELIDVLMTGMGARTEPMIVHITTAGYDRESICWEKYQYAKSVRDTPGLDAAFLPVIFELEPEEDWLDESLWPKANPNLGVSVSWDFLRAECKKAQEIPAYENTFRNLYLNQWVGQAKRWLPMEDWDACGKPLRTLDGRRCYAGLDLAATTDTTALVLVFPDDDGGFDVLPFFWIPGDNAKQRERRDRVPYGLWEKQGYITLTEGRVTNLAFVESKILELCAKYDVRYIGFDPYLAQHSIQRLQDEGLDEKLVQMQQGWKTMSFPAKELEKLVLSHKLRHAGHPVLRAQADCCAVKIDESDNYRVDKGRSSGRIDGIVALIMAIARAGADVGGDTMWEPFFVE